MLLLFLTLRLPNLEQRGILNNSQSFVILIYPLAANSLNTSRLSSGGWLSMAVQYITYDGASRLEMTSTEARRGVHNFWQPPTYLNSGRFLHILDRYLRLVRFVLYMYIYGCAHRRGYRWVDSSSAFLDQ